MICGSERWMKTPGGGLMQHICKKKSGHAGKHFCCRRAWPNNSKQEKPMPSKIPTVRIKQPEPPAEQIQTEILAQAIMDLSAAFKKVQNGPLGQRAIVLLVQDACSSSVSQKDIKQVLDVLPELVQLYTKKPAAVTR